ncbi:unnamed protein product, partial [Rotaria sordida]
MNNREKILDDEMFLHKAEQAIFRVKCTHVLNADQSTLEYAVPSTRTLSISGEKTTLDRISSQSAV